MPSTAPPGILEPFLAAADAAVDGACIADLMPRRIDDTGPDRWRVLLGAEPGDVTVELERVVSDETWKLTCHAASAQPFPAYRLISRTTA